MSKYFIRSYISNGQSIRHVVIDGSIDSEAVSKGNLLGDYASVLSNVISTGERPIGWDVDITEVE